MYALPSVCTNISMIWYFVRRIWYFVRSFTETQLKKGTSPLLLTLYFHIWMTLLSPADEQQDARIRDLVEFTERNRMREVTHTRTHAIVPLPPCIFGHPDCIFLIFMQMLATCHGWSWQDDMILQNIYRPWFTLWLHLYLHEPGRVDIPNYKFIVGIRLLYRTDANPEQLKPRWTSTWQPCSKPLASPSGLAHLCTADSNPEWRGGSRAAICSRCPDWSSVPCDSASESIFLGPWIYTRRTRRFAFLEMRQPKITGCRGSHELQCRGLP